MAGSGISKLTISRVEVNNCGAISEPKESFTVMINPSSYKHEYKITYNEGKAEGSTGSELSFARTEPETVSFDIIIDGTGVVKPLKQGRKNDPVKKQIKQLRKILYTYDGKDHQPNHLQLLWGDFKFYCRLTGLTIDYTMFKPGGEPLRAKLTMNFKSFMSREEEEKQKGKNSPDLTHVLVVKAGDALPLLCNRIYKNCAYYLEVAAFNDITNFRDIEPGATLYFPPITS